MRAPPRARWLRHQVGDQIFSREAFLEVQERDDEVVVRAASVEDEAGDRIGCPVGPGRIRVADRRRELGALDAEGDAEAALDLLANAGQSAVVRIEPRNEQLVIVEWEVLHCDGVRRVDVTAEAGQHERVVGELLLVPLDHVAEACVQLGPAIFGDAAQCIGDVTGALGEYDGVGTAVLLHPRVFPSGDTSRRLGRADHGQAPGDVAHEVVRALRTGDELDVGAGEVQEHAVGAGRSVAGDVLVGRDVGGPGVISVEDRGGHRGGVIHDCWSQGDAHVRYPFLLGWLSEDNR